MQGKRSLASALGLGLMLSSAGFGQAMIEYGHGVAKAGVAGAASGTGLVGIFSTMKDTSEDKDKNRQYTTAKPKAETEATQPQTSRSSTEPANTPTKMTTSSGVVVSGVSPSWMTTAYRDPVREPVRVKSVAWSNSSEENAAVVESATGTAGAQPPVAEGSVAAGTVAAGTEASTADGAPPAEGGAHGQVVHNASPYSWAEPQGVGQIQHFDTAADAEIAGVRIGSKIEEVIANLGQPKFSFTGIVGKGYTEKYVFKNANGDTITVLTWAGTVTSVIVS
jgi:hypothetical protein